jgi:uncharacterized membrane protein
MITAVLIVVGAILGGMAFGFEGAFMGAAVGLAIATFALSKRLERVEHAIEELKRRTAAAQRTDDAISDRRTSARVEEPGAPVARPAAPAQAQAPPRATAPTTDGPALQGAPAPRATAAPRPSGEPGRPAGAPRPSSVTLRVHREPDFIRWLRVWFTTGNVVAKIGALILFIGVAFLLKYYAEHTRVPIEVRLIGVCAGALVALGFGWKLRQRQRGYALILQGVSVAVLYLVIFAALRLYSLLPPTAAFALLVAMGVFSAVLAIAQNSMTFAMMGAAGGFLAPVLTSTGQGSHVVLFTYFALLDAGIVAIAWFRSWRPLNLLGFAFTFGIGTAWGVLKYRPEHLATTEPFLILFFVFFVAIAILFAFRQAPKFTHYVDGTLVFGTPLIGFALQSALVRDIPYALAYSAVAVAAFYLILARVLNGRQRENLRLLVEAFLALGVAFATLAIPLALDGRWTAAAWALEGAAILWVGLRQNRLLPRIAGMLLQFGGGIAYALSSSRSPDLLPVLNSHFIGSVLVSGAGLVSGWLIARSGANIGKGERLWGGVLFFWGLAWWLFAGAEEIDHAVASRFELSTLIAFVAFTAAGLGIAAQRLSWTLPRIPALCLLPVMLALALISAQSQPHPFADGGVLAWPFAFAAFYFLLKRHDDPAPAVARVLLHAGGLWLLALVLSAELKWVLDQALPQGGVWPTVAWAVVPATILLLTPRLITSSLWPFSSRPEAYIGLAAIGFHVYLALWSLFANLSSTGDATPLPYVPLLNPLDIAQAFVFLAMISFDASAGARCSRAARRTEGVRHRHDGVRDLRVAQRGAVAHPASLGARAVRSRSDGALDARAELALDLLDAAGPERDALGYAPRAAAGVVRRRRAARRRGAQAHLHRSLEGRHGGSHRLVRHRRAADARARPTLANAARGGESHDMTVARTGSTKAMATALLLLAASAAQAQVLTRADFAYSMEIETSPGVAVHRMTLPLELYRNTTRADLADLRVFNAAGEVVPYALRASAVCAERKEAPVRLPMFPLHGDVVRATQALSLTIRTEGANIDLHGGAPMTDTSAPVSGYLLDARTFDAPIAAFSLEWPEMAEGFSTHVMIEASDDLSSWRSVGSGPLVDLRHGTDRLLQQRVEVPPTQARFWRLRWGSLPGPVDLNGAMAERPTSTVEPARLELVVQGKRSDDMPGEFLFDLGAHAPVDRFNLVLPQVNTVADATLLARSSTQSPWRLIASGSFYRLQSATGEVTNPDLGLPPVSDAEWLLRLRNDPSSLGADNPKLVVRWIPHELVFVARGEAPYTLAYGSGAAQAAWTALDTILPRAGSGKTLSVGVAQLGPQQDAGGAARLEPREKPLPWRTIVLWAVLVAAVGLLGTMAMRLGRQLKTPAK